MIHSDLLSESNVEKVILLHSSASLSGRLHSAGQDKQDVWEEMLAGS